MQPFLAVEKRGPLAGLKSMWEMEFSMVELKAP